MKTGTGMTLSVKIAAVVAFCNEMIISVPSGFTVIIGTPFINNPVYTGILLYGITDTGMMLFAIIITGEMLFTGIALCVAGFIGMMTIVAGFIGMIASASAAGWPIVVS